MSELSSRWVSAGSCGNSGQRLKLRHRQLVDSAIEKLPDGIGKAEWPARLAIQDTEQCLIVELSMMVYGLFQHDGLL